MSQPGEPEYAKSQRNKKDSLPWWEANIDAKINPTIRKQLETYSGIPSADVRQHIYDVRDKAWEIRSYPFLGKGVFLDAMIAKSPAFSEILERVKSGAVYLDIGCYLGVDMRRLILEGAPSDRLYGIDIVSHWDLGYDFFRDREKFHARFIECSVLAPSPRVLALHGQVSIIWICQVLHQWDWETQVLACTQLAFLSSPDCIVAGFHIGRLVGEVKTAEAHGAAGYRTFSHDASTFERMWQEIGEKTGTRWVVKAWLARSEEVGWAKDELRYIGPEARVLGFVVRRVI